jgi:predicted NAD-dependent protein-ADP-ribosyltransferase YbiA (DUF1768 family)
MSLDCGPNRDSETAKRVNDQFAPVCGPAIEALGVFHFGSGAGVRGGFASNFCELASPIECDGLAYPTTEHAFQAVWRLPPAERHHLALGGSLSTLDGLGRFFDDPVQVGKKKAFWGRTGTGRPAMPGIVAKMAVSEKHSRKLGLHPIHHPASDFSEMCTFFMHLLRLKYEQNPEPARQLLATGDKYLLEFSRGARREHLAGKPPLWTGMFADGRLYGHNLMGRMMMKTREEGLAVCGRGLEAPAEAGRDAAHKRRRCEPGALK